jgi:hypothetical protein
LLWLGVLAAALPAAAAPAPGGALRDYLRARLQGDLAAAQGLWDPRDLRRAGALGIAFTGIEASYDDYWMLAAPERQALAAGLVPVVSDSVTDAGGVRFTVLLRERSGAVRDTLRYVVQETDGAWRVALPWSQATREWTRRESRFLRLRGKRLVMISQHALAAVDNQIQRLFEQLGTPQTAQLRLERIKLEYYLCETDDDVRALVGATARAGYLPAGGRVVARVLPDMSQIVPLVLHLTVRDMPLHNAPIFEAGLAAAFGGTAELDAAVYVQRARNACMRDPGRLGTPFDPKAPRDAALPVEAVWNRVLLQLLGPEKFVQLVATSAAAAPGGGATNAAARRAIEAALGRSGDALLQRLQEGLAALPATVRPGCDPWPGDIQGLQAFLQWRDGKDEWGLQGYEIGEDYVMTVAPHDPRLPKWMRQMVDSLASVYSGEEMEWNEAEEVERPSGDPPPLVFLVRAKLEQDLEPYESPLFAEHFLSRPYKNDMWGLFVTPDDVRLYDYTRNKLVAEYELKTAPPGGRTFYDAVPGRICFALARDFAPRPLTAYYVALMVYTGE